MKTPRLKLIGFRAGPCRYLQNGARNARFSFGTKRSQVRIVAPTTSKMGSFFDKELRPPA
jgi:hypothetical protein